MMRLPDCDWLPVSEVTLWASRALSETWLIDTVISSTAAAMALAASDWCAVAAATCEDEVASCAAALATPSALAFSPATISRRLACILRVAAIRLRASPGLTRISAVRSPWAMRSTAAFASSGSPPSGCVTERMIQNATAVATTSASSVKASISARACR